MSFDNFKVRLSQELSRGHGIRNYSHRFFPVRHILDYSQLFIPFLCTSTDLETSKLSLMKEGDLVQSVLASTASPSLIAPVEINRRLYIDRGVSVNIPVK
ncbi:patatin-like phospholipase family protein [Bacteroidetes bacterium endosymbiont of Geopemphigus sp.]|uniref:patatin-like phospholipase family protein n=1 Tax=Bacteroidetes bacterium endosymbiont of Geopemphigus sp. TaxID=2047937 RepID=UPI000CD25403|nr:patatin-like phospholipase family protein [Bacteroidetes bacterium endosymbiont of Geopemphigus sp.]